MARNTGLILGAVALAGALVLGSRKDAKADSRPPTGGGGGGTAGGGGGAMPWTPPDIPGITWPTGVSPSDACFEVIDRTDDPNDLQALAYYLFDQHGADGDNDSLLECAETAERKARQILDDLAPTGFSTDTGLSTGIRDDGLEEGVE